jgi:hypothetical protein
MAHVARYLSEQAHYVDTSIIPINNNSTNNNTTSSKQHSHPALMMVNYNLSRILVSNQLQ